MSYRDGFKGRRAARLPREAKQLGRLIENFLEKAEDSIFELEYAEDTYPSHSESYREVAEAISGLKRVSISLNKIRRLLS